MNSMLFVHIPKTAGTSFRISLEGALGSGNVFYDYGVSSEESKGAHFEFMYGDGGAKHEDLRLLMEKYNPSLLYGHFQAKKYIDYFSHGQVGMFFRDPVERMLSDFLHFKRHLGFKGDLKDFCSKPAFRNRQSWFSTGIDIQKMGFIGLTHRYDESLKVFADYTGVALPCLRLNAAPAQQIDLSSEELRWLLDANEEDIALYKKALAIFEERIHAKPLSEHPKLIACINLIGNHIQGWVVSESSCEWNPWYHMYLDGEFFVSFKADVYRKDLKINGISRSGSAGFLINIGKTKVVSRVDICHEKHISTSFMQMDLANR